MNSSPETTNAQRPDRPKFRRVSIYNSHDRRLSFWYNSDWQIVESAAPSTCVTLLPEPADPATVMTLTIQDVESPVAIAERDYIVEGIEEGLSQLENCVIERMIDLKDVGDWGLEWVCTFSFSGQRRRRRARLFFSDHYQSSVMFQGSSEERFEYWRGMFEFTMLTVSTAGFDLVGWAEANQVELEAEEGGTID